jgi:hypothetical protein
MIFHLPSHLFINREDCFQYPDTSTATNITTANTNVVTIQSIHIVSPSEKHTLNIDQEEPEFTSPAHIVLVQIQLLVIQQQQQQQQQQMNVINITGSTSTNNSSNTTLTVPFSTKLHVRYPKPFSFYDHHRLENSHTITTNHETFRHYWIAPPILISGYVTTTNHHNNNGIVLLIHRNDDDDDEEIQTLSQHTPKPQALLQVWIAGGHQSHFTVTIVTTITVALLGSWIMLYDLCTIAIWI